MRNMRNMRNHRVMSNVRARNSRKDGIVIPADVVRAALGVLAVAVVAIILAEAPEAWRYYKLETM